MLNIDLSQDNPLLLVERSFAEWEHLHSIVRGGEILRQQQVTIGEDAVLRPGEREVIKVATNGLGWLAAFMVEDDGTDRLIGQMCMARMDEDRSENQEAAYEQAVDTWFEVLLALAAR